MIRASGSNQWLKLPMSMTPKITFVYPNLYNFRQQLKTFVIEYIHLSILLPFYKMFEGSLVCLSIHIGL